MKQGSIRYKIILLTLVTLIPLVILQVISIQSDLKRSVHQKMQSDEDVAKAVSKSFINCINELWVQEDVISKYITFKSNDTGEIQECLESVLNRDETVIKKLSLINPEGVIVASTEVDDIGRTVTEESNYKRIMNGEEKVLSNLSMGYQNGETIIPVSRAIMKDGKVEGILVAVIDIDKLISKIPNIKSNEGDELALIDRRGYTVYSSDHIYKSMKERLMPKDSPVWGALKGEIVKTYIHKMNRKPSMIGLAYPIKEFGWVVSISSNHSVVLEDCYSYAIRSIVILFIVGIISLAASYKLGKMFAAPLLILKEKAAQLKGGDYSVRTNIIGVDEIASTAEAFDLMADSIQEYDKLKSQFFSNLSHELKTPINVIYSTIQLFESLDSQAKSNEYIKMINKYRVGIKQNCFRLMKLVDNMIDVTRFDSGYLNMLPRNINIISAVEDVSLSVVKFAEQKGVQIIFDTEVEEKEAYCDPYMIERIMLNLISNSLKFTDKGGFIYINIFDKQDKINISVRDTGIGIPENKLGMIFDRFSQVDSSLNRNQEGSGLGLSIVTALVKAHKGSISVKSEVGVGTEFLIELPIIAEKSQERDEREISLNTYNNTIQKIQVEFSDIYSIQLYD